MGQDLPPLYSGPKRRTWGGNPPGPSFESEEKGGKRVTKLTGTSFRKDNTTSAEPAALTRRGRVGMKNHKHFMAYTLGRLPKGGRGQG